MPPIGRNTKVTQLDKLTDEEIQRRWAALFPKFIRWGSYAAAASLALFLYNHFFKPNQRITDIATAAFQITLLFTFCFVILSLAAAFFRSNAWRKKSPAKKP